jgi:two-component system, OmpR family, KDP operon response regulator KdpE
LSTGRILVVDDAPQIRRVMRTALSAEGYVVDDARTAEEALTKVHENKYDLVLLDINMPGLGGLDACRSIREVSEMAIIMLTVRNSERDRVEALDAGADDFVSKPFSTPELLARIRAALRRLPLPPEDSPPLITLGEVEINVLTRRVSVGGKEIRLTPKEFDLLHFLAANVNVPIPHAKILQTVWGPDYRGEVEYLRVFINRLRKKLEADPANPRFLLTEPWIGYRFNHPE